MTGKNKKACDVFISHSAADSDLASEIASGLESAGLETFRAGTVVSAPDISKAIWLALAESRALVAIISPAVPPHAMGMIEIGAAAAWKKPIFLLLNGPSSTKLPAWLAPYPAYPTSRLEEVIRAIRSGFEPLTESERGALAKIYQDLKIRADQLSLFPEVLEDLTAQFKRITHKQFAEERLLTEILRMRKKGQLPRSPRLQPPRVKPTPLLKGKKLQPPKVRPTPLLKGKKLQPPRVKPTPLLKGKKLQRPRV